MDRRECKRCHEMFEPPRVNSAYCRRCIDECDGHAVPKVRGTRPCARCGEPVMRRPGRRFCTLCVAQDRGRPSARTRVSELSPEDCDVVDRWVDMGNAVTIDLAAARLGITRQGVQHIVDRAMQKLAVTLRRLDLVGKGLHL